ncbi:MAG: hypothetical protein AABM33_02710 [Pseudomonadota bacterium]
MNLRKATVLSAVALLVGVLGSNVAEARHGGRHFQSGGGYSGGSHFGGGHGHGGGRHFGGGRALFFAAPLIAASILASRYYYPPSYYYDSPSYYYPPHVYYPPTPPVYIEQGGSPSYAVPPQSQYQPDSQSYWYYCQASRGYYPHVQNCPGGWQRVAPQPSPR